MGIVSIVIAGFALVIAVVGFVMGMLRYRIPLEVRIPSCIVLWSEGNQSLVLFRLISVNHSLRGRTVVKVAIESPIGIIGTAAVWIYDDNYEQARVLLPNSAQTKSFPISEVLFDALDIPPHQSRSKWVGFLLDYSQIVWDSQDLSTHFEFSSAVPIFFLVSDVMDKPLTMVQLTTTLNELKTVGVHPIEYTARWSYKTRRKV